MPQTLKRVLLSWCMVMLSAVAVWADRQTPADSTFETAYRDYLLLYSTTGHDEEFYAASATLQQYYLEREDLVSYYKIQMNEALYDTEHNQPYRAIKTANAMLDDMKSRKLERYDLVYTALGTVYESRGNDRMAEFYYKQAQENLPDDDPGTRMGMYSRLSYLLMLTKPDEARNWNAKYLNESLAYPPYHQVYLFIECMIDFATDDKAHFSQMASQYYAFREANPQLDNYGLDVMDILKKAFDHHYAEALKLLEKPSSDLNDLDRSLMRGIIHTRTDNYKAALSEANFRANLVDSLNSDMLFNNLNQINAEAGLAKARAESTRGRERLMMTAMISALVVIGLLAVWIVGYRRMSRRLREKNQQLATALAMAEESDKMKTEFVRSVSHEIRTPLNAIAGFNEIVNDPTVELPQEERQDLVSRINENVQAITAIVDEMLHLADRESQDFYARTDKILCNQFFSQMLYQYRDRVSSSIELSYTTRLLNRTTIDSNEEGVRRIVEHLIQNAIKFTSKGTINLHCQPSDDGSMLQVEVTDTGRGISAEGREKIFEQFYKEDSFQQGIGLGLTVSRKLARKLGGDLTLDEAYTDGARFVLTLPL